MRPSLILEVASYVLIPILNLVSFMLLLRGHNFPGGGFIGGLVLSASLAILLLFRSEKVMLKALLLKPEWWIALGLCTALGASVAGPVLNQTFLTGLWASQNIPFIGKIGSPVIFDLGVYWTVLGVCSLMILYFKSESQE